MMDHADRARALFLQGYNCAQAMLCAYSDVTGFDEALSARLASSFGGGMGRLRQVCGAMSAALMVLGLIHGYDDPADPQAKADHYRLVREYAARFEAANGSIICRTLLENAGIDGIITMQTVAGLIGAQNFSMPAGYVHDADN